MLSKDATIIFSVLQGEAVFSSFFQFMFQHRSLQERGKLDRGLFSTLQSLSHRRNTSSLPLLQLYFHGKCSDKVHSLVLSTVTFTTKIVYVKYTGTNHSYSIHISLISSIRTASSQESLLHGTNSPDRYNLTLFKSVVNQHRFYIQSSTALLISISYV